MNELELDLTMKSQEISYLKKDCVPKKENIELRDSCARIVSKNESCKGKVWDSKFGFVPRDACHLNKSSDAFFGPAEQFAGGSSLINSYSLFILSNAI